MAMLLQVVNVNSLPETASAVPCPGVSLELRAWPWRTL